MNLLKNFLEKNSNLEITLKESEEKQLFPEKTRQ